jgi:hypothetical protein
VLGPKFVMDPQLMEIGVNGFLFRLAMKPNVLALVIVLILLLKTEVDNAQETTLNFNRVQTHFLDVSYILYIF